MEKIKTVNGESLPLSEAVLIGKDYYKLGNPCVENSGDVYKLDNELVFASDCRYDSFLQKYTDSRTTSLMSGVIGVEKSGKLITGYFQPSFKNTTIYDESGKHQKLMSIECLEDSEFFVKCNKGYVRHVQNVSIDDIYEKAKITKDYKNQFDYGVSRDLAKFQEYFKKSTTKATKTAKLLAKMLDGLSIGVEFETAKGIIPSHDALKSGLISLRDGSIEGIEYVTIPLEGEKGCQFLINAVKTLNSHTESNSKCALHYHIGNIPRTEKFIVALWIFTTMIQDQLFEQQPVYKRDARGFKQKNYSQPLPLLIRNMLPVLKTDEDVLNSYKIIYNYLAQGSSYVPLKDTSTHPADPTGRQKWNIHTRYAILNMIPLIFGNHKTVEFRHHEISTNPELIINELIINASIIRFVKDNTEAILANKVTYDVHSTVINYLNTFSSNSIIDNYYKFISRKAVMLSNDFLEGKNFSNFNRSPFKCILGNLEVSDVEMSRTDEVDVYKAAVNTRTGFIETSQRVFVSPTSRRQGSVNTRSALSFQSESTTTLNGFDAYMNSHTLQPDRPSLIMHVTPSVVNALLLIFSSIPNSALGGTPGIYNDIRMMETSNSVKYSLLVSSIIQNNPSFITYLTQIYANRMQRLNASEDVRVEGLSVIARSNDSGEFLQLSTLNSSIIEHLLFYGFRMAGRDIAQTSQNMQNWFMNSPEILQHLGNENSQLVINTIRTLAKCSHYFESRRTPEVALTVINPTVSENFQRVFSDVTLTMN